MTQDVWPLLTSEEMRALDRHTIDQLGVPGDLLMESAGRAVAEAVLERRRDYGGEVWLVCGGGNNGADGLVAARQLQLLGVPLRVCLLVPPSALRADAAANWKRACAVGVRIEGPRAKPGGRGVVVDAIFGTGLSRKLEGAAAAAVRRIERARSAGCPVVAVDLPSGVDSDTGQVHGSAVVADCTVTLALPKLGLALEPGRSLAGEVWVARIGVADSAPGVEPRAELWSPAHVGRLLPTRPRAGHKGSFGHVLLVAGSEGKTGAASLAAEGALRAGAGLVTLACPAGVNDILEQKCTEAMTAPVPDTAQRSLAAAAEDAVWALAAERDAVGCGPGVGRSRETQALMRALLKRLERPLVLDADALFAYADEPGEIRARRAPTVLTPHPGEASRLLGRGAAAINRDRLAAARELARLTGAVILLKGAATVVAEPGGRVVVNATGGPALAAGGTGDVLTGVLTTYLAQGMAAFEAAACAAHVHGAAADRLSARVAESGLLASEIAGELPAAAEGLRFHEPAVASASHTAFSLPFPGA